MSGSIGSSIIIVFFVKGSGSAYVSEPFMVKINIEGKVRDKRFMLIVIRTPKEGGLRRC